MSMCQKNLEKKYHFCQSCPRDSKGPNGTNSNHVNWNRSLERPMGECSTLIVEQNIWGKKAKISFFPDESHWGEARRLLANAIEKFHIFLEYFPKFVSCVQLRGGHIGHCPIPPSPSVTATISYWHLATVQSCWTAYRVKQHRPPFGKYFSVILI